MDICSRQTMLAGLLFLAGLAGGCTVSGQPLAYTEIDEIQPGPGLATENGEYRIFSTRSGPGGLKGSGQKAADPNMSPAEAARQAAIAAEEAAAAAERAAEAAERVAAASGG